MGQKTKQPHASNLCGAKTRNGTPCKNHAMANGKCRMHGGKSNGAPKKNKHSEKHGFFSKYLPEDTLEIVDEIDIKSPNEILWENIQIQYAAIIRAQRIFYVKDIDDHTKDLTYSGDLATGFTTQHSWDKQEKFLNAQSRAMTALNQMIERYIKLAKTDEQELKAEKLRAEIGLLKAKTTMDEPDNTEDDGFLDALNSKVDEVWQSE